MADAKNPVFDGLCGADGELARGVAARIGMILPDACTAGVAANARLIAQHVDIMRRAR